MSKIRVYELAKEMNKSSRDIIIALKRHGMTVESHVSLIPEEAADRIREYFKNDKPAGKAKPARAAKTKTAAAAPAPAARAETGRTLSRVPSMGSSTATRGTIDSRGNFVMASDIPAPEPAAPVRKAAVKEKEAQAEKTVSPAAAQETVPVKEDVPAKKAETAVKEEQASKTEVKSVQNAAETAAKETAEAAPAVKTESAPAKTETASRTATAKADEVPVQEVKKEEAQSQEAKESKAAEKTAPAAGQTPVSKPAAPAAKVRTAKEGQPVRTGAQRSDAPRTERGRDAAAGRGPGDKSRTRTAQTRTADDRGKARPARDGQAQGRGFARDGAGRPGGSGSGAGAGSGRPGGKRPFGGATAAQMPPAKDDSRRNHKNKDRDNKKSGRDYEETGAKNRGGKGSKGSSMRTNQQHSGHKKPGAPRPAPVVEKVTSIELPETITIKELADKMKIPAAQIIKKQFLAGNVYTINSDVSYDEAEEIALEYDILCEHEVVVDVIEEMLKEEEDSEENMVTRPPVVCVMGHVDHGKTSILDAIRNTHVTSGEAGGITQHIGAYVVDIKGQKITFLDTPGHEAFTEMRLRGAQSTDIAILVVAADDGVMPQTVEAINHAKAAGIDIIVAINKIDKPGANVDRVKQELMEYELIAEDWGGKTIMVPVSAHTGEGLDDLLDMILLDAEVLDLKANPSRKGRGLILEAQLDKGRGAVATVLVQKGTLRVGDNVTCGTAYGKIRAMIDDKGKRVKTASLSTPVEVLGLNGVPLAGEVFLATDSEKEARSMAETFIATNKEKMLQETKSKLSLESLFDQIREGQIKELNIVVKADVQGSVEAVKQSLVKLSNDEVAVKVIHGGVGAINESDVILASASNAIVIGFNVRPDNQAKTAAEQEHVDMRLYRVIYNAIEDIEAAMKGMLEPVFQEKIIGHAEVRQTYRVSSVGTIIGGYVQDGQITRSCRARLLRDNVVIYDGELGSLKRFKDDVKEVNAGYEFGMSFDKFNDIKEGDQVEAYIIEEVPR